MSTTTTTMGSILNNKTMAIIHDQNYQGGNNDNGYTNNRPSINDPILGQTKIVKSISKKFLEKDKVLETLVLKWKVSPLQ